ncbi:hypothetical protein KM914_09340 [Virgibacillus pantothenticus]|uniref:hypothetical protein n=1 Tax=Virgibacillus pantothenticus TaxID=1473 RepID=UPI000FFE99E5|nr:hypothetical protein [Virgibacillus pantothenticus]MBU8566637.1 hypothetical protein [Virgibacillus pantothenticus]MBU8645201.1 hypothetical protein [Virgibacillus pantothenticus]MBU8661818.1 hypothetical protein [Virgibacillus pantothenticus]MBU8667151.1 hypothetical protein [Virgibacillus pantothenticus]MBU8671865.1 hypothetical protein [Virgibacillus pantothenticus]
MTTKDVIEHATLARLFRFDTQLSHFDARLSSCGGQLSHFSPQLYEEAARSSDKFLPSFAAMSLFL